MYLQCIVDAGRDQGPGTESPSCCLQRTHSGGGPRRRTDDSAVSSQGQ